MKRMLYIAFACIAVSACQATNRPTEITGAGVKPPAGGMCDGESFTVTGEGKIRCKKTPELEG